MGEVLLELKDIKKKFDGVGVLEGINLSIERGEFITCLLYTSDLLRSDLQDRAPEQS